jgi:uncharacterized membrane protein
MADSPPGNDKIILAVSFLAVLVTMYGYKDNLNQFKTINSFSLFDLLIYMSGVLFLSVYLSALANLRFSYVKLENSYFLRMCDHAANLSYLVAILALPTAFFGSYIASGFLLAISSVMSKYSQNTLSQNTLSLLTLLISIIMGLLTLFYTYQTEKVIKETKQVEEMASKIKKFREEYETYKNKESKK